MKDATLELHGGFAGAKLVLTNPETGEGTVVNVSPSVTREIESIFEFDAPE
ncbi:hypothetical protein M199_gp104 [Halogranum tailed virus 1]|uniref:Uncharacterized protein n=1 Tax=Halogranum tailed virus 1 TaxID=1273749 RepID=R4TLI7_9CAUD|nr:hypothetical protein M199_gp104 [Halogranum tailed virus 1]AGM11562.1 hypothetical protein HGTV1_265 [Halogranum tailed virus 1]